MIIAARPGTGSTTFARQFPDAVELSRAPYRWVLPVDRETDTKPACGRSCYLYSPLYPANYLADILKAEKTHRFVLIPADREVADRLQKDYSRKVLLCHADDEFRPWIGGSWEGGSAPAWEYRERDQWGGVYLSIAPGKHLTDLRRLFEEERRTDPTQP